MQCLLKICFTGVLFCTKLNLTRRFTKRNWVAFMIVNISELDKGNGELYMTHGNLHITMVYLRYS